MSNDRSQRSPLERFLGIFTEVRAGEGGLTLAMAFLVFLLLTSYYLMRPVRKALILQEGGAEHESYLYAVMAFLLFFLVQGYSKLVSRYERTRLISVVTSIFVACMVGFWLLGRTGVPYLGYAFFVWVGIFAVMVVAQFWSYANDVYSNEAGKRLFPIVGFGALTGALVGSDLADRLLEHMSVWGLVLAAAVLLSVYIVVTNLISLRVWGREKIRISQSSLDSWLRERKLRKDREKLALGLLKEHRYLGYIALLVAIFNLVNTQGEYILGSLIEDRGVQEMEAAVERATAAGTNLMFMDRDLGDPQSQEAQASFVQSTIGDFYSGFYRWQNLAGMFFQLFVVSRLIKYGGMKAGLLWLPIIALGTYSLILALPVLSFVRVGKIFENSSDYSVNKTAKEMLFLPTSRDVKYKAKQAIDSLFQRVGDVSQALLVFVGTTFLGLGTRGFALINVAIIIGWFFLLRGILREYHEIEAGNRPELTEAEPATG